MKEIKGELLWLSIGPGGGYSGMGVQEDDDKPNSPKHYIIDLAADMTWKGQSVPPDSLVGYVITTSPTVRVIFSQDAQHYGLVTKAEFYQPGA